MSYSLSTLETIVADFGENGDCRRIRRLSPKTATVSEFGDSRLFGEYRERQWRCHVWWKTVPEAVAGNLKSSFADGGEVERRYSKFVLGSRLESLPTWHIT